MPLDTFEPDTEEVVAPDAVKTVAAAQPKTSLPSPPSGPAAPAAPPTSTTLPGGAAVSPKTGLAPGDPRGMLSKPDFSFSSDALKALDDPKQFLTSHQRAMDLQQQQISQNAEKRRLIAEQTASNAQKQQATLGEAAQTMAANKVAPYVEPDQRADMGAWLALVAAGAALMSGKTRNSQMYAMAGFTGAINGFMAGKKEQAEHGFKVWKANQEVTYQNNANDLKRMQLVMQSNQLDNDQKMAQFELIGGETQDSLLMEMSRQKNLEQIGHYFDAKAKLQVDSQAAYARTLAAMAKWNTSEREAKSPNMNTPAGLAAVHNMIEAETDPVKKKQLIWQFQMMHSGGAPGGQGNYPEPEPAEASGGGVGGWLSRLFGGGGATGAPAGGPGDGSTPSAPLPKPATQAGLVEGKWYNMGTGTPLKLQGGKFLNQDELTKIGQ